MLKERAHQGTCSRDVLKKRAEHGSTRDTNVQVIASARSAFVTCEHRSKTLGAYSVKCWRARVAECRRAALSTGVTGRYPGNKLLVTSQNERSPPATRHSPLLCASTRRVVLTKGARHTPTLSSQPRLRTQSNSSRLSERAAVTYARALASLRSRSATQSSVHVWHVKLRSS